MRGPKRTVVSVTHRLAACREADRIAVLEQGRLVEVGTYQELLGTDGAFSRLVKAAGEGGPSLETDHA